MKQKNYFIWVLLLFSLFIAFLITEYYDWGLYEFAAIASAFHFLSLMLYKLGKSLPIKELTAFIYILQLLIGSIMTYKFFPKIPIGYMVVTEDVYYRFTFLYVGAFIFGLYFPRFKFSNLNTSSIVLNKKNDAENVKVGLILIFMSYGAQIFSSLVPSIEIAFVYILMSLLRYVGLYYLWMAKYKYRYLFLAIIFIPFASRALGGGLFIELFIWTFLSFSIFQLRRPFSLRTNVLIFLSGVFVVFLLQSVKVDFRKATWNDKSGELSITDKLYHLGSLITSIDLGNEETRKLANQRFVVRINQGYINSFILKNMPARHEFVDGKYFIAELKGIFMPRFLAPEKAKVADHAKFEEFAGWKLDRRVAMCVSILGDGYGNFGFWGGMIFCLLNGVFLNFLIHLVIKISKQYENTLILWMPMIFTYAMRSGDEFYIYMNHIVKSTLLIVIIFYILKRYGFFYKSLKEKIEMKYSKIT